jgi:tetratricopeptide (TPR) repeat protein
MSRNEESVRYYTEALRLLRSNAETKQLQSMKTNVYLGNVYIKMKLYDRAYDHFTMALTELQADFNSYDSQMPLRGLAYLFLDQKKPELAKRFLDKAHQQLAQKGDIISKMRLNLLDAEYLKQMGEGNKAKDILKDGLQLFHQQEVAVLKIQYLNAIADLEKQVED